MWKWILRTSGVFLVSSLFLTSPASAHPHFYVQFGVPGVSFGYGPAYAYPGYAYPYPGYVYGYPGYAYPWVYSGYGYRGWYGHRYYGGYHYYRGGHSVGHGHVGWHGAGGHGHH